MKIVEKDFKLEFDGSCWVLYFLRTKKELKDTEDSAEVFKIKGYYSNLFIGIRTALRWRLDDKYPFKESYVKFQNDFIHYKRAMEALDKYANLIYDPIYKLEKQMYNEHKQFLNRS